MMNRISASGTKLKAHDIRFRFVYDMVDFLTVIIYGYACFARVKKAIGEPTVMDKNVQNTLDKLPEMKGL